jgi:D-xylose transport system substrate-binding protein
MAQQTSWRAALSGIAAVALLSALAGPAGAEQAKPKIAFLLKTMQEQRYELDKSEFTKAAEKLGAEVMFAAAGNDEERQIQEVEAALQDGAKVLVLQPVNTGTAGALVAMAHGKGVRVIGYDSMLTNGPLDGMVMQDSWAVGRLQSDALVDWLQHKYGRVAGSLVLIMGQPGDSNAQAMSSGVWEMLAKHPDVKLLAARSEVAWSPDAARDTAATLLQKYRGKIDAFICNNSGMAYGVAQALHDEGLADATKVFLAGADADLRNIRLVAQGVESIEIWKPIAPLAQKAAEVAVAVAMHPDATVGSLMPGAQARNNGFADVPTIVTPVIPVTRETIDTTVVAGGLYTRAQIDAK